MKKILLLLPVLVCLSACGFYGHRDYVAVEPHNEEYQVEVDSKAMTVNSYLSLKNAILDLVEDAVEEGVIRAESYTGDLSQDLSDAVYEVTRGDPMGAFAVDYMTYDYSKIVSYYEIHVHTTYRRTLEEIQSVQTAASEEEIRSCLADIMSEYGSLLRIQIEDYSSLSIQDLVKDVFRKNPDFALELPNLEITTYPETGSHRIVEIGFQYSHSRTSLNACKQEAKDKVSRLAGLYGSSNSDSVSAQWLLERLIRDGELIQESAGFSDSCYGALCLGQATALGYCQAYLMLLQERGIPCQLVEGVYGVEEYVWCQAELSGAIYYIDPARCLVTGDTANALIPESSLEGLGYVIKSE